jgi:uncharacterized protein YndB with AHSA1/START domain
MSSPTSPIRTATCNGWEAKQSKAGAGIRRYLPRAHVRRFRAAGTFLQIDPPHRLAFTRGFADDDEAQHVKHKQTEASSGSAMPARSTRVTVTLDAADGGTRLTLRHNDLPDSELRDGHRAAWETYLPRLAIRAAGGDPGPDPHAQPRPFSGAPGRNGGLNELRHGVIMNGRSPGISHTQHVLYVGK